MAMMGKIRSMHFRQGKSNQRDRAADESVAQHDQEVAEGATGCRAEVPASGDADEAGAVRRGAG